MINKSFLTAVLLLIALPFMAQPKKTFTLDDLLSGGSNFWNLQPKNLHTTWWGDVLVELDVDECRQISDAKGRSVYPKFLFTLDELNAAAGLDDKNKVRSLYYASFPDGERKELVSIEATARLDAVRMAYAVGGAVVLAGLITTPAIRDGERRDPAGSAGSAKAKVGRS